MSVGVRVGAGGNVGFVVAVGPDVGDGAPGADSHATTAAASASDTAAIARNGVFARRCNGLR